MCSFECDRHPIRRIEARYPIFPDDSLLQRLPAFLNFLESHPECRGNVHFPLLSMDQHNMFRFSHLDELHNSLKKIKEIFNVFRIRRTFELRVPLHRRVRRRKGV